MTDCEKIAELIFGDVGHTPEDYEEIYPPRQLKEGQRVARMAPSPTGYLHLGVLFTSLVNRRIIDASGGVFYLRIEDTDAKREVDGGMEDIINGLIRFGINIDEGYVTSDGTKGIYGPYKQSERAGIYHCFAKRLMQQGYAYPCFCSEEQLQSVRAEQEAVKERTGYYGKYARCRDLTYDQIAAKIRDGLPYVVRLRSPGQPDKRIAFDDGIKGKIEMPENDEDFVLLKSDGIPTYHFAHAVDDHLMRTTHVVRGDEWISSVPKHLQLFRLLGFKPPKYSHVSPIMKEDNGGKRKLSKRKDPEAAVHYYAEQGYPAESVTEYLLTVANSDFEDWRRANPDADSHQFKFNMKKMSVSGALFDIAKLNDVSKNVISRFTADRVVSDLLDWSQEFDGEFYSLLSADTEYAKAVFSIDRGTKKPRKDIAKWSEAKAYAEYFYDPLFDNKYELPENISAGDAAAILNLYKNVYSDLDEKDEWFARVKSICEPAGFCPDVKAYKQNPDAYKGHVGDVSTVIRIAVTGRSNTPDLCAIMRLLGRERVIKRIENAIRHFNEV
jgi:glutamyl-tRNA synthetase